jgi:hypothetical protein
MRRLLLALPCVVLLAGCRDGSVTRAPGHAVGITIADYRYEPQNISVAHGQVFFAVKNAGPEPSNLVVRRAGGREVGRLYTMAAGAFKTLTLHLSPGQYEITSTVGKQSVLGEYGSLTVR